MRSVFPFPKPLFHEPTTAARGMIWGLLGVLIFSLTAPMTRLALHERVLSPWFVWAGRGVIGAVASLIYLWLTRAPWPPRRVWGSLLGTTLGIVFGWPLLNTLALQSVPSSHAAVINGILPLSTAVMGAWLNRERHSGKFWLCAVSGALLVCGYAWQRAQGTLHWTDALMLLGVVLGGFGYASGGVTARVLTGPQTICWALLLAVPWLIPVAWASAPSNWRSIPLSAGLAFGYLCLMSQWLGFFFWYRGLALGGIARVGQVQLLQLFFTLGFSALLLHEAVDQAMWLVAVATFALILLGRRASQIKPIPHGAKT